MTPSQLLALAKLAEAATPGKRGVGPAEDMAGYACPTHSVFVDAPDFGPIDIAEHLVREEAEFIAAFDRETCLALISAAQSLDELKRLVVLTGEEFDLIDGLSRAFDSVARGGDASADKSGQVNIRCDEAHKAMKLMERWLVFGYLRAAVAVTKEQQP